MQVWHRDLIPPLPAAPLRLQLRVVLRKGAEVLQAARRLLQRTAAAPAAGRRPPRASRHGAHHVSAAARLQIRLPA